VLWLTGKSGTIGLLVGSFVMIATLVLPLLFIATPSTSLAIPWTACALLWTTFAAGFLLAPTLKAPLGRAEAAGERVVAVLQLHAGRMIDPAEIQAFVKARIGSVKAPKQVEVWPELPRSKIGKVMKKDVRAELLKRQQAAST